MFDASRTESSSGILKKGSAMRVVFFYPGEEGAYIDDVEVTIFQNGIVHLKNRWEETTTHLQNCEIVWRFDNAEEENRAPKVKLLHQPRREPEPPKP